MSAEDSGKVPLVSGKVFGDLEEAMQDPERVRRYLLSYLGMWDDRFVRLAAAVSSENVEAAVDAVLSIRTSAQMVGAVRLATLVAGIERHLAGGEIQAARSLVAELEACGQLTMDELRRSFLPRSGTDGTGGRRQGRQSQPGPGIDGWFRRAQAALSRLAPRAGQRLALG